MPSKLILLGIYYEKVINKSITWYRRLLFLLCVSFVLYLMILVYDWEMSKEWLGSEVFWNKLWINCKQRIKDTEIWCFYGIWKVICDMMSVKKIRWLRRNNSIFIIYRCNLLSASFRTSICCKGCLWGSKAWSYSVYSKWSAGV